MRFASCWLDGIFCEKGIAEGSGAEFGLPRLQPVLFRRGAHGTRQDRRQGKECLVFADEGCPVDAAEADLGCRMRLDIGDFPRSERLAA